MKIITKRIHAFLDYPVAIALIVLPFLLGLGTSNALALQLSVTTGIAAFILTLLTNHHLGAFKVISYQIHLIVDFIVAIVFISVPIFFPFKAIDAYYYWINGVVILTVITLDKSGDLI